MFTRPELTRCSAFALLAPGRAAVFSVGDRGCPLGDMNASVALSSAVRTCDGGMQVLGEIVTVVPFPACAVIQSTESFMRMVGCMISIQVQPILFGRASDLYVAKR